MDTRQEERHRVAHAIAALRAERDRWEALLRGLDESERTAPKSAAGWSIQDYVAHLMAWQQVSNARLEAAARGTEPAFPDWLGGESPESEEHIGRFNDTIHAEHAGRPWERVHAEWRAGFDRLLARAAELPEETMLDASRFTWLGGYALVDVLEGSLAHHREHREILFPDGGEGA